MFHFYSRFLFVTGFLMGIFLATVLIKLKEEHTEDVTKVSQNQKYNWLIKQQLRRNAVSWDKLRYEKTSIHTESEYLFKKITVLCVILVKNPKNAIAANNTWTKGCNSVKFINLDLKSNKKLPAKRTKETSSWVLLCTALKTMENHFNWIVVVNDYTFVILENLRYSVAGLDPSDKYYLGHAVSFWSTKYNTGQAGYVLSKGSLNELQRKLHESDCSASNAYWNREDFYLGKHLASLNITPSDTRDSEGMSTFFPYNWYHVFFPGENYYKTSFYPTKCCSKHAIAFQAIEGDKMYTYFYILYTLQRFVQGNLGNGPPPAVKSDDEVWKQFLMERNVAVENVSSEQYYKLWEDLVEDPTSFARNMKKEQHFDYD